MLNNLIRRNFDAIYDGSSFSRVEPIFNPSVGNALHIVIKELCRIASGEKTPDAYPVSIEKFKKYIFEAKQAVNDPVKALRSLKGASFEEECGVRIACFLAKNTNNRFLYAVMERWFFWWLKNPIRAMYMTDTLQTLLKFNEGLNDYYVRSMFPELK